MDVTPRIGPIVRPVVPRSADPYLYVDPATSRVFALDASNCLDIIVSDDDGTTWQRGGGGGNCLSSIDHPTLFAGRPVTSQTLGYPNIVYQCSQQFVAVVCSKSLDGGRTFMPTGSPDHSLGSAITGHGIVGPDGSAYLPRATGQRGRPELVISRSEGLVWKSVEVAKLLSDGTDPSVAVDAAGNLYFLFTAEDRLPYLVISRDRGLHWGTPLMVGAPGVRAASLPAIKVGAPGKIAFLYMGTTGPPPVYKCLELGSLGTLCGSNDRAQDPAMKRAPWNGYMSISVNVLDAQPVFFSAAVNDPAEPLIRGFCESRCEAAADFLDIAIAPDGTPWGTFVDGCISNECRTGIGEGEGVAGQLVGGPSLR